MSIFSDNEALLEFKNICASERTNIDSNLRRYLPRLDALMVIYPAYQILQITKECVVFALDCPHLGNHERGRLCSFAKAIVLVHEEGLRGDWVLPQGRCKTPHSIVQYYSRLARITPSFSLSILTTNFLRDINQVSGINVVNEEPDFASLTVRLVEFCSSLYATGIDWGNSKSHYYLDTGFQCNRVACIAMSEEMTKLIKETVPQIRKYVRLLKKYDLLHHLSSGRYHLNFIVKYRKNSDTYILNAGRFTVHLGKLA